MSIETVLSLQIIPTGKEKKKFSNTFAEAKHESQRPHSDSMSDLYSNIPPSKHRDK